MKKFIPMILILSLGVIAAAIILIVNWREPAPLSQSQSPPSGPQPAIPAGKDPLEELKSPKKGLRVLFVGNSHTFTNNLPDLVTKLASKEDRPLLAYSEAPGGTSFQMHAEGGRVEKLIGDVKWDLVVLQDQSAMPNLTREQRDRETLPFARKLDEKIQESGARTVLFMTWGYQSDFLPMQQRSREAYTALAADLKADLVPVGTAWEKAFQSRPGLDLWMDGNHATMKGTYLAACVFYAAFYGKSPVGNSFTASLDSADSRFLQETAACVIDLKNGGLAAKAPGRVP